MILCKIVKSKTILLLSEFFLDTNMFSLFLGFVTFYFTLLHFVGISTASALLNINKLPPAKPDHPANHWFPFILIVYFNYIFVPHFLNHIEKLKVFCFFRKLFFNEHFSQMASLQKKKETGTSLWHVHFSAFKFMLCPFSSPFHSATKLAKSYLQVKFIWD